MSTQVVLGIFGLSLIEVCKPTTLIRCSSVCRIYIESTDAGIVVVVVPYSVGSGPIPPYLLKKALHEQACRSTECSFSH